MIKLAEVEQRFNVETDRLFSYVTDMENYKEWFPGVKQIKATNKFTNQDIGKCYQEKLDINNELVTLTITVVKYDKNKLFVTHGDLSPLLPMMKMVFEEKGDHVLFTLSYYSRNDNLASQIALIEPIKVDIQQRAKTALKQLGVILQNN